MTIKRDMRSAFRFALRKRPLRTWLRPLCSRWSDELETFSGSEKEEKMIHAFKTRCFQRVFIFPSQNILANIIQVYYFGNIFNMFTKCQRIQQDIGKFNITIYT